MKGDGKNIRKMVVTPETGKNPWETKVVSGVASPSSAFKARNETTQYTTGKTSKGPLGGENTNS